MRRLTAFFPWWEQASLRRLFWLYAAASAANVLGRLLPDLISFSDLVTKPLIMPLLALFWWRANPTGSLRVPVVIVLLFSWLGDLMLMGSGATFFLAGLGSFLVAQLLYAWVFSKNQSVRIQPAPLWPIGLLVGYGVALYSRLADLITELPLKIGVGFYTVAILFMAACAYLRLGKVSSESFRMGIAGSLLFVLSDSLIAINTFAQPVPMAGFWIMLTYTAAQFLLVAALCEEQQPG